MWVQVLKAKYGVGDDVVDFAKRALGTTHASWSQTWRGLIGALQELSQGLVKRIGDGESTRFWVYKWLDKPILDYLDAIPTFVNEQSLVSNFMV